MKASQFVEQNGWPESAVLVVFVMAFTVATFNHVMDLARGGLFPYSKWYGTPEGFNYYWTSLTLLDPLAVVALFVNVRAGFILALCIMLTDVPINLYVNANHWLIPLHNNYALLMQIGFLVFLLLTVPKVWILSTKKDN